MKFFIPALAIVLSFSCHTMKSANNSLPAFDKEAHRGGRGLMPENTIPAMLHALDLGVTTLEMDAVITADRVVVVSHEPFFNHAITTKPDGSTVLAKEEKELNIFRMNYEEVRRFDVGLKPYSRFPNQVKMKAYKPRLDELIDSVEAYAKLHNRPLPFYNIETKTQPATDNLFHPAPAEFVELLMDIIKRKNIINRVIIQSFDFRTLKLVHSAYPMVKTAALVEAKIKEPAKVIEELGFKPSIYSPEYHMVNAGLVKQCHDLGLRIIPWTVNTAPEIRQFITMGVDGIISDYPDLFPE